MFINFPEVILSSKPKQGFCNEVCQRSSDFPSLIGFHDLTLCRYTQLSPFSSRKNESHIIPIWEVIFLEPLGTTKFKLFLADDSGFEFHRWRTLTLNPPVAKKFPRKMTIHGIELTDDYHWLKEKTNKEVIDYLEDENRYTAAIMQ